MAANKNMLEAFRSADGPKDPPATTLVQSSPRAPGPLSGATPAASSSASGGEGRNLALPGWAGWVLLIVLAFLAGRLTGKQAQPAHAEEGETPPVVEEDPLPARGAGGIVPSGTVAGSEQPVAPTEPASNAALLDKANEFTIVVATYGRSNEDYAWATFDFLREQNIPAYTPYQVRGGIVVLAGAAPRKTDLESLVRRVRGLSRDGVDGVYDDAYIHLIDKLIPR